MPLQKPSTSGSNPDQLPVAVDELYANDAYLDQRITAQFGTLTSVATASFGTTSGTVADGGALTAEIARAKAAEQANAAAIQTNSTAIANETSRAQAAELLKAPIESPALTGVPTAPTASSGTNSNQIATCAFVLNNAGSGGGGGGGTGGVPPTRQINTTGLLSGGGDLTTDRTFTVPAASQSDVATGTDQTKALTSFSVAAALGAKAPLASPAFVGFPTAPTLPAGANSTGIATAAYADRAAAAETSRAQGVEATLAPLASPAFTGTPTAPTPAAGDSSTKIATTAFAAGAKSIATNGYQKLPSGLILQWGQANNASTGDYGVTFPIAFPTATLNVVTGVNANSSTLVFTTMVDSITTTGFAVHSRYIASGGSLGGQTGLPVYWFAIGY